MEKLWLQECKVEEAKSHQKWERNQSWLERYEKEFDNNTLTKPKERKRNNQRQNKPISQRFRQPETNVKNAPTRKNGTSFQQMNTGLQSRKTQNREEVQQRYTRPQNQQRGRSDQQDRPRKFSRIRDELNARKPTYAEAARSPNNCRSERKRQATTTIDYNQRQPKHFLGSTHGGNYPPTNNRQLVRNHQQNQRIK
ncbi:Hypothetical predicted protein [Paramuricea clavata]|uniref:Uncharacterized protein n=1 Tax=Paramuricea clavata TaxID=317549 RepID=A0A6S7JRW9_PARCT|nr:Hypothetical predicted protein [Paramuricea clavata]